MAKLPERYRQFLLDVEPILTDLERDTLLKLTEDYQRDRLIDAFWKRRSEDPAFREVWEMRLHHVKEKYRNINTDQGRIYLINGPPDGIRKIDCQDVYWPIEIWYYERLESLRMSKVLLVFYQTFGAGDYKLWTPMDGAQAVLVGGIPGMAGAGGRRVDVTRCGEWRDVQGALSASAAIMGSMGSMKLVDDMKTGAKPNVEGADSILQMTTDVAPGAATLPIQRTLRFPEMIGNKMRMELAVMMERDSLTKKQIGPERSTTSTSSARSSATAAWSTTSATGSIFRSPR